MSQNYELTGRAKVVGDAQTFGSGFTKRELVVTVEDGKYPQDICLEFVQDKVSLLDSVSEGDEVTVHFNLRGREHNGRYFSSLQGWRLNAAPYRCADAGKTINEPGECGDDIPF